MPTHYPVNEMFHTIQGEARFTGTPAVFVRLQGCAVGCPWCDTKHTWHIEKPNQREQDSILAKDSANPNPEFAVFSGREIAETIAKRWPMARHVVITGGEPGQHDLVELAAYIERTGRLVQVETSGCYDIDLHGDTWITVSPKLGTKIKQPLQNKMLVRANEIKWPIGNQQDLDNLLTMMSQINPRADIWLQPLSQNKKATALCVEACLRYGFQLSLQTHKFAGIA